MRCEAMQKDKNCTAKQNKKRKNPKPQSGLKLKSKKAFRFIENDDFYKLKY